MIEQAINCPDCGSEMTLKESRKYKDQDGNPTMFYGCSTYPTCKSTHRAKSDGTPIGIPADQHTKALRVEVHKLCERIWGTWEASTKEERKDMFNWLHTNAPKNKVSEMDADDCEKTIELLQGELVTRGIE